MISKVGPLLPAGRRTPRKHPARRCTPSPRAGATETHNVFSWLRQRTRHRCRCRSGTHFSPGGRDAPPEAAAREAAETGGSVWHPRGVIWIQRFEDGGSGYTEDQSTEDQSTEDQSTEDRVPP